MMTYTLPVEIEEEEDGRWSAVIPLLPGCATWGYTKEEAVNSLQEATKAYLEVLLEQKGKLPAEVEMRATTVPDSSIAVADLEDERIVFKPQVVLEKTKAVEEFFTLLKKGRRIDITDEAVVQDALATIKEVRGRRKTR